MTKSLVKEGDIFTNTDGCEYVVLKYNGSRNVLIRFLDTDAHEMIVETGSIFKGCIKNPFHRRALGVGFMGVGAYSSGVKESPDRGAAYRKWKCMLERCYGCRDLVAYKDVVVCEEWHNFQNFANWATEQKGFTEKGWELDKDILSNGVKIYSPETCAFIPKQINSFLVQSPSRDARLPHGVLAVSDGFLATAKVCGKRLRIGLFKTCDDAEKAYIEFKTERLRELAEFWKDRLDIRVYDALMIRGF